MCWLDAELLLLPVYYHVLLCAFTYTCFFLYLLLLFCARAHSRTKTTQRATRALSHSHYILDADVRATRVSLDRSDDSSLV